MTTLSLTLSLLLGNMHSSYIYLPSMDFLQNELWLVFREKCQNYLSYELASGIMQWGGTTASLAQDSL